MTRVLAPGPFRSSSALLQMYFSIICFATTWCRAFAGIFNSTISPPLR